MEPIAHTITESATLVHTTETKIRSEIMSGRLPAHVAPDGRILITAQALAAYVSSMPRFQPVTPESLADQVRQDAAARARGRAIATKSLAPAAVEPGRARGRALASKILGKAKP